MPETTTKGKPQTKLGRDLLAGGAEYLGYLMNQHGRVEYFHKEIEPQRGRLSQLALRVTAKLAEAEPVGCRFDARLIARLKK